MSASSPGPPLDAERALRLTRIGAGGSTVMLLLLAAASEWVGGLARVEALALPAGLIGLVSPVIGRHLYELMRQRRHERRPVAFLRANLASQAVTEAAGLFGLVAFALSGKIVALTGVLMHVLLVGALWPTDERYETFCDDAS